jgi:hypothetical protein
MKFIGSILFSSVLTSLVSASSFENTAPLLISSSFLDVTDKLNFKDIDTIANTNDKIQQFMGQICKEHSDSHILYLKIHDLDESDITSEFIKALDNDNYNVGSNHVVYKSDEDTKYLPPGNLCSSSIILNIKSVDDNVNWAELSSPLTLVELYNDDKLYGNLKKILPAFNNDNIIIQGLPTFKEPLDSILSQASLKINNLLNKNSNKREEDVDYDAIEEEFKQSFEEVNELLDDEIVSIYSDVEESQSKVSSGKSNTKTIDGSLFDKYAFFSNGIWMGTIVFLFLAWLLSIALSWLNSLKISYAAFDKPFDFEKKLQ